MRISFRLFVFIAALAFISTSASAQTAQTLTLQQAEQLAIQNHPQIQVAAAEASLADAEKRQVRASYFPVVNGSITGAEANDLNRIGAGVLNDPRIFPKFAQGFAVNQLVTDFGHTYDIVKSANLHRAGSARERRNHSR